LRIEDPLFIRQGDGPLLADGIPEDGVLQPKAVAVLRSAGIAGRKAAFFQDGNEAVGARPGMLDDVAVLPKENLMLGSRVGEERLVVEEAEI